MPMPSERQDLLFSHQRLAALLEEVPSTSSARAMRTALLRSADAALARNDLAELRKLRREVTVLLGALRRSAKAGQIAEPPTVQNTLQVPFSAGPEVPQLRWPRRHSVSSSWRRPYAPVQYPCGDPPTGWETRLHETTTSMPDSKSSAESLARLNALRRSRGADAGGADNARRVHGSVGCHGTEDPPDWFWPNDVS